jgi:hypothetical protein
MEYIWRFIRKTDFSSLVLGTQRACRGGEDGGSHGGGGPWEEAPLTPDTINRRSRDSGEGGAAQTMSSEREMERERGNGSGV